MKQGSGGIGILTLAVIAAVLLILRRIAPSLGRLFLILGGIAVFAVIALVAVVIFFAFHKPKKTPEQLNEENAASMVRQGRAQLMDIRRLASKVKDRSISGTSNSICSAIEKILQTVKDQPKKINDVGRFFRYYLPTMESILTKYIHLETNGTLAEDTTEKTLSCLKDMESAMEKQYLNLFEADKLDLSVEMEVLLQVCRKDGLLADDYPLFNADSSLAQDQANEQQSCTL